MTGTTIPEHVYHYTSVSALREILKDGYVRTTPSNLLKPTKLRFGVNKFGRFAMISDTDEYKPVVWACGTLDFRTAKEENGLAGSCADKTEVAIEIDGTGFVKWDEWASSNEMDEDWKNALTRGMNYKDWYVRESDVRVDGNTRIIYRPDVTERADMPDALTMAGFGIPEQPLAQGA